MSDHIYKLLELTGSSTTTIEDAVQNALARASKSVRNMHWFHITDTRGTISAGGVQYWQVTIKVGFTLEDCKSVTTAATQACVPESFARAGIEKSVAYPRLEFAD